MKSIGKFRAVIVCLVLAAGFGIAWGIGVGVLGGIVTSFFTSPQTSEDIILARDGTPLIHSRIGGNYYNEQVRTLDGEILDSTENLHWLWTVEMYKASPAAGVVADSIPWEDRISVTSDSQKPPVIWNLIRNANRPGGVYLAGYDATTAHNVGYLGREGLRSAIPPKDEWFDVGYRTFKFDCNVVAEGGYMSRVGQGVDYNLPPAGEGLFQPWSLFICDGDTVQEVNLRDRKTREVASFDNLVGVEIIPIIVLQEIDEAGKPDEVRSRENRLLVRTKDQLILYNVFESKQFGFQIPVGLEDKSFGVSMVGIERLMLHIDRGYWEQGNVVELLTIAPDGTIEQKDTVRLVNYVPESLRSTAFTALGIAPTLLPLAVGMLILGPLAELQNHTTDTFQNAFNKLLDASWPALLLLMMVSLILAAVVYHWQKKYSRPYTSMWTILVFLTTVPGFLGYWAMHRRAPLAVCPHCGKEVPRNSEACARCAEPYPEPKLLGTEVFA